MGRAGNSGGSGSWFGAPIDETSEGSWDLSIALCFESLEDVATYVADPDHRRYVDEYLKPKLAVLKAWNFELVR